MPSASVKVHNDEKPRRRQAVRWYVAGMRFTEICERLDRHSTWLAKWIKRYRQGGWNGLRDRSRRPHHFREQTDARMIDEVIAVRTLLERLPNRQTKVGAAAIRQILLRRHRRPPSISTIERILRRRRNERRLDRRAS